MIRIFTSPTQSTGEKGESAAVQYLKKEGFVIVERNVAGKYGEIDIVARKGKTHYFFEVKAGRVGSSIHPAENLHPAKIRKFLLTVEHYCLIHQIGDYRAQGVIVLQKPDGAYTVETIELN